MSGLLGRLQVALAERYKIEREIGRGGMATVFLAEDLKHRRPVALKVVSPDLAASLGTDRFLREIEIAARLTHPHILSLQDSGEADGMLYYVMPYVEGESLRGRLNRERQLPLDDALRISREVADALDYAHGRDVLHRDIKPENILFQSGHAVVSDFGIARAIRVAGVKRVTGTGIAVGTPGYMSPEQAGGVEQLDGRSDLYSLACVLYEMLAGDPPFTGWSAQAILARQAIEPVPRLRAVRDTVPEWLEQVVAKALAKAPADRFATVRRPRPSPPGGVPIRRSHQRAAERRQRFPGARVHERGARPRVWEGREAARSDEGLAESPAAIGHRVCVTVLLGDGLCRARRPGSRICLGRPGLRGAVSLAGLRQGMALVDDLRADTRLTALLGRVGLR